VAFLSVFIIKYDEKGQQSQRSNDFNDFHCEKTLTFQKATFFDTLTHKVKLTDERYAQHRERDKSRKGNSQVNTDYIFERISSNS
jgi:hypothetical protein